MSVEQAKEIEEAIRRDGRFPPAAFEFLHRAMIATSREVYGERSAEDDSDEARHVTGRELCHGLRRLAARTWGPLAPLVLKRWGIRRTRDFGEMVYLLIELGVMRKQESDRIEDFDNIFDIARAFDSVEIGFITYGSA